MEQIGITSTSKAPLTIADLNEKNHRFWQGENDLFNKRVSDVLLFDVAMTDMRSETLRQVPVKSQETMEQALADAEKTRRGFKLRFLVRAGRRPNPMPFSV